MTYTIPKELIKMLDRNIFVAAKGGYGKTALIKALGAELLKSYNLSEWVYLSEFASAGKGTLAGLTMADKPENVLFISDMFYQPPSEIVYGGEIRSARITEPSFPDEDADRLIIVPCADVASYKERMTVVIAHSERFEDTLTQTVTVYPTTDISVEPLGTFTVTLPLPKPNLGDLYKAVKPNTFMEFVDAVQNVTLPSRYLTPTLRGLRVAINSGKNYTLVIPQSETPPVLFENGLKEVGIPLREMYHAAAIIEIETNTPAVDLGKVALVTIKKWGDHNITRSCFTIGAKDSSLIEQYLKGYERRNQQDSFCVSPPVRVISAE